MPVSSMSATEFILLLLFYHTYNTRKETLVHRFRHINAQTHRHTLKLKLESSVELELHPPKSLLADKMPV